MGEIFDTTCACLENATEAENYVPTDNAFKQFVQDALCQIVAGGGGGGGGTSTPFEILCDDNGPFLRVFSDPVTNFTLAGAAYVPVGTVATCGEAGGTPYEVLCDVNAGVPTKFIRIYSSPVVDIDADGVVYVPTGTVGFCAETEPTPPYEVLCDVNIGVPTKFIRIYSDPVQDIDFDGVAYVTTGTVGFCELECCPPAPFELLQDDNGVIFIRSYNSDGTTTDIGLDGAAVVAVNPVLPYSSGGGAAGGVQVDAVTLNEVAFRNLQYYTGGATGGGSFQQSYLDYTPNGAGGRIYSGVFAAQPRSLEFSADYLTMYAINSTGLSLLPVNMATGVAAAAIPITGLVGGVSVFHISMHPDTEVMWAYAEIGATTALYTINLVTGAATLQGSTNFNLNANAGFGFLPDGRLVYCDDPTATSFLIEIIPIQTGTMPAITTSFATGKYIIHIGNTGSAFRGPMAATYRNSVLSVPVNGAGIAEFDFSGAEVRISTSGSITSGGSIAYFHPLGTRKLFLGMNLRRVTVTDNTGLVTSTQYFTPDGTDVSAVISPEYVSLEPPVPTETPVEAIHIHGTILGSALTTAYANIVVLGANYNGGGKILQVYNSTDRDVYLAWTNQDNSADQLIVPEGGTLTIDYAANDRVVAGNLQAKAIGSTATSGTLYATIIR